MNSIVRSSKFWFVLALCTLVPLQIWFVVYSPWFAEPPKPIGDGPDYESIAYHLYHGRGWSLGCSEDEWREPYRVASLSQLDAIRAQQMPLDRIPIADYSFQLSRNDVTAPTTSRPPLFPTVIAIIYGIFDRGPTGFAAVRIAMALALAIAGSLAVAMTAAFMSMISTHPVTISIAALTSLILAALDRPVRNYATDFLTEPFALLLMQLWIISLWNVLVQLPSRNRHAPNHQHWWHHERVAVGVCGALLALLIYTRSLFVLWVPGVWLMMLLPAVCWRIESRARESISNELDVVHPAWRAMHRATMTMLVCLILMFPWWVRNCIVLRAALPLGTQGSTTLLGGYHDLAIHYRGEWQAAPELQLRQRLRESKPLATADELIAHEVAVSRAASRQVASWIRSHLSDLPYLAWLRVKSEWGPYKGRSLLWKLAAITGLWVVITRLRPAAILLGGLLLISTLTVAVLYSVGGRFLVPNYGSLYTLAGIGVAAIYQEVVSKFWTKR